MALIDEIRFHAKAGNGGTGVVRWRHEKNKEYSGAAGGNGGPGGDIYVRAVRDQNILARHKKTKNFQAGNGEDGRNGSQQGKGGEDCHIELPIGSVIVNEETGRVAELLTEGEEIKILHGGRGGLGNEHFKASTNVRPEQSTGGMPGESADFKVELNLIADAGLIGLPNAGKSSLLNALTSAHAKVGAYEFTTIDPNLGPLPGGYIVADLPGLIEGASEGKGLGHKFLKHIKRTKVLVHLVAFPEASPGASAAVEDAEGLIESMQKTYAAVREELKKFGEGLPEKEEVIVLTKADLVPEKVANETVKAFKKINPDVLTVTVLDDMSVKKLSEELNKKLSVVAKI